MAKSRVDSVVVTEDGEFAGQTETCTPYRHTKCGRFVVLKHNLLSQHDIADWDILLR
jgi:hypothetical protein